MAKIIIDCLSLTIKHLVTQNGSQYYQRKVPKDLIERYGFKLIKLKLNEDDGPIAKQILQLAKLDDLTFKAFRNDVNLVYEEQKQVAYRQLAVFKLKPGDGSVRLGPSEMPNAPANANDQPHLDSFIDNYIELARDGKLTKTDELAYKALQSPLPIVLSELIDIYLKFHPDHKGLDEHFSRKAKRDWNRFIEIVGNIAAERLDRNIIRTYINKRESAGVKSGTVQRELNTLRAVITIAKREGYFYKDNPFEGIRPTKKNDAKKRETYTFDELSVIRNKCLEINDDIRQIVLVTMYTGARIGEIVGLRKQDCILDKTAPYIRITDYSKKTVKTSNSVRNVPLLGEAWEMLLRAMKDSTTDAVFPRYNNLRDKPRADSASTYVGRWLKEITNTDKTSHCFRHTVRDLLRNSNATKDVMDEIHGGAKQNIADTYGEGRTIKKKYDSIKKAWKPFFKHIGLGDNTIQQIAESEFKKKQAGFNF
jgi:integrase